MNITKLREAEALFLQRYPGGFSDPAMEPIKKKHNVDKLIALARENLSRENCRRPNVVADILIQIVGRSSMVSRFEKPRFRDFVGALGSREKGMLAAAIEKRLYGKRREGFEEILDILQQHKLAKWSLISVVPFYASPNKEVFVKPTTAKGILRLLEVEDLHYEPTPSWGFYRGYQQLVSEIKRQIAPTLAPNNAALTGFLMMSL